MKYFLWLFSLLYLLNLTACSPRERNHSDTPTITVSARVSDQVQDKVASSSPDLEILQSLAPFLSNDVKILIVVDPTSTKVFLELAYSILGDHFSAQQRQAFESEVKQYFEGHFGVDLSRIQWVAFALTSENKAGIFIGGDLPNLSSLKKSKVGTFEAFELRSKEFSLVQLQNQSIYGILPPGQEDYFASLNPSLTWQKISPELQSVLNRLDSKSSSLLIITRFDPKSIQLYPRKYRKLLKNLQWGVMAVRDHLEVVLQGSEEAMIELKKNIRIIRSKILKSLKPKVDQPSGEMPVDQAMEILLAKHLLPALVDALTPEFEQSMAYLSIPLPFSPEWTLIGSSVFAAVAVPSFIKAAEQSKLTEAKIHLQNIADGSLAYYQAEHTSNLDLNAAVETRTSFSHRYPKVLTTVCTSTGDLPGQKQNPNPEDFQKSPWKEIGFKIRRPHAFKYCYRSDGNQHFAAWATAHLDEKDPQPVVFCIRGSAVNDRPVIDPVRRLAPGEKCTF